MPKIASRHTGPRMPLDQRLAYRFSVINRALTQHLQLYVGRVFGLNLAEHRVLRVLAEGNCSSIRDIAARTQLDKAHVTRALASLIKRGLASQIVDQDDRRLRMVTLTPMGRATREAVQP